MLSFHNKPELKEFYLQRVKNHHAADEIIKGKYWEAGKGCAVGCTVHSSSHSAYETDLGIPRIIARLQDRIFEGMSNDKAKDFPVQFIENTPIGVDLNNVWRKFLSWLLIDEQEGVIRHAKTEAVRVSILNVGNLLDKSTVEHVTAEQFKEVRKHAAAAYAAYAAAYAAYAAAYAAYAAAYAYADAAYAYADAAYADAAYADADAAYAAAAYADADAAKTRKYDIMAEKLLQLLKEAK
jgi:hypothetical protein